MRPKQILDYYSRLYPQAWKQVDMFRANRGKDLQWWPDWCFLPMGAAYAIVFEEIEAQGLSTDIANPHILQDVAAIGALAAWRVTQGVYRFDPNVFKEVINTPITGNLPNNVLFSLPEWCIYIETPGLIVYESPMTGFFVHLEYDVKSKRSELHFLLDFKAEKPFLFSSIFYLGNWTLKESIQKVVDDAQEGILELGKDIRPPKGAVETLYIEHSRLMSLVLYICAISDIRARGRKPKKPKLVKTRRSGMRMFPASRPTIWDVGVRMGAQLRAATKSSGVPGTPQGSKVRPHVRRAHWHAYWTGPRDGKRKYILKWLSPILVGGESQEMPVTIRPVK